MHPWTIAIAGAVALSLAGTSPGDARRKLSPTVMPEAAPVFWPDAPANLIEYLGLDAPTYLTGATIFIDGGQTAFAPLI